jgi:2-polyprenyl-3-methyl-5-hydroxy-6-metoxy-1,4-benzoquinol methylase
LDPVAVERLADVLVACGYLSRRGEHFRLTEVSQTTLIEDCRFKLVNWVKFCGLQLSLVRTLEHVLSGKGPIDLFELMPGDEALLTQQRAMAETAEPAAAWVAEHTPVRPGASLMLDVGGSHGIYSAAICKRNPPLRSRVLELPSAIRLAAKVSKEYGTDKWIDYIEGDITATPLRGSYDLVFMGNIIHHLSENSLRAVLSEAAAHVEPAGTVAIWDIAGNEAPADETRACFSLLFYLSSGARCYTENEIVKLLETSGFDTVRTLRAPSTHTLFTAKKQKG